MHAARPSGLFLVIGLISSQAGQVLAAPAAPATARPGTIAAARPRVPVATAALALLPAWSFQGNQATANVGTCVSTAGDVNGDGYSDVLVTAPKFDHPESDEGRIFVFHGSPSGPSLAPSWSAEGDLIDFQFGGAAAAAGDVNGDGYGDVIVGGSELSNGQLHEGRACVYLGSPTGLAALPAWTFESNQAQARLGNSVAAAGDVNGDGYGDVIVGASGYSGGQSGEGRAFVFLGSPTGPALAPSWTAENNQADSHFGQSVCTAGDVNGDGYSDVIIGAHLFTNVESQEGAAYCYYGSPGGLALAPSWMAESNQLQAFFGASVSTAGDVNGDGYADVIVGAYQWDTGQAEEGRAFVYLGGPLGLAAGVAWFADGGAAAAYFGGSVATAGDVNLDGYADVIVGAKRLLAFTGTARVFLGSAAGLAANPDWSAFGGVVGDWFGASVCTAGDVDGDGYADVIVGAPQVSDPEGVEGAAYVYRGQPRGMSPGPQSTLVVEPVDGFGSLITGSAGDVNGDGFADLFVAWPDAQDANLDRVGRVFVYHGSPLGCSLVPDWSAEGAPGTIRFGVSVASAGDVNGDGYEDLIVGQRGYLGVAFVFLGSPTGLAGVAAWSATSVTPSDDFGSATACAGDVNGDGYSDVVVGAGRRQPVHNGPILGAAYLWYGSATGLGDPATTDDADWWIEGTEEVQCLGSTVASAGDVNGDGFSDLLIAAPRELSAPDDQPAGFSVFYGSPQGPGSVADWSAAGDGGDIAFDVPAGGAGDVNGDGYSDVFAKSRVRLPPWEDAIHVWYGSAQGLGDPGTLLNADARLTCDQIEVGFGFAATCAGDVNGDGFADLLVGAQGYDIGGGGGSDGVLFLFRGSPNGLQNPADWSSGDFGASQPIGGRLGAAGDVNGDGFGDIVAIDRGDLATFVNADLWYGERGGPTRRPRQQRSDGTTPIAPLGLTDVDMSAVFSAYSRSVFGRTRARLEWEVGPLGVLFDGAGTNRGSSWSDTGVNGVSIAELDDQVALAHVLHWRARLHFDPAMTPFASPSRWFTVPLNGWNEADFRVRPAATAVEPRLEAPTVTGLTLHAAPHPLRPGARISLDLPVRARVEVSLHDITGARRLRLGGGRLGPGTHEFPWSGRDDSGQPLAPGMYFVRIMQDGRPEAQHKVVVLR